MRSDEDFSLVEPFGIDNGELDGIPPHQCFVLGVEWQTVYDKLNSGEPFACPIRFENEQRIVDLLTRHGRVYSIQHHDDDWPWLSVEGIA